MPRQADESNNGPSTEIVLMPDASRYAGQPVDVSSRRSIDIVLSGNGQEPIEPTHEHTVFDQFYHAGQFWRAVVPLDGIDNVFGQAFNFSKARRGGTDREVLRDRHGVPKRSIRVLNHLQSRFTFRAGQSIWLYPLGGRADGAPAHQLNDFVYSVEAVGPPGVTFNVRDAFGGNLIGAHRFLSTQQMVFERLVVQNQYVIETPPLPLSDFEKRMLLSKSLLRSHFAGATEFYRLFGLFRTNNCTSNPFQILDSVVDYTFFQRMGSMFYRFPLSPRLYLRIRGMDSDPAVRKLVRDEFEDYIGHPETQKRKREYVRQRTRDIRAARERRKPMR